jgi:hypothetical protein
MSRRIAIGCKPHSGWAAVVAVAGSPTDIEVLDRRRVELLPGDLPRMTYHAAEDMKAPEARRLIQKVERATAKTTAAMLESLLADLGEHGTVVTVAVLGTPRDLPPLERILGSHPLLHSAEGELYRGALADAAAGLGLDVVTVAPKGTIALVAGTLGCAAEAFEATLKATGKALGPPWQQDHRDATAAALLALNG